MTDSTNRDLQSNGLSLTGWGATLRVWGREVLVVCALLILAGGSVMDRRDRMAEHQAILEATRAVVDAQSNLACMLAVSSDAVGSRLDAAMDPQGACHYITTVYQFDLRRRQGGTRP